MNFLLRPRDSIRRGSFVADTDRISTLESKINHQAEQIDNDSAKIAELEARLARRSQTINDMRRDFALELLQLRLSGASEGNKLEAANRAMERLKRDEEKILAIEAEKESLEEQLVRKDQEILVIQKEAQMEGNRAKAKKAEMQKHIYELEDKLRASQAEVKQKNNLLSGKNAIVEQLNFSLKQRDESYHKLEKKLASVMV